MLRLAGLQALVDELVDADVIRAERPRSRPAPDLLLVGCRRLGVQPHEAATFTHSAAGVAAGQAAGMLVVGIGTEAQHEPLQEHGAGQTVPSLSGLHDRRLGDGAAQPA
jgi:beta-phosphoglucomutase-like phosphatase (HAD superfamily)